VKVSAATTVTPELASLFDHALKEAAAKRGGTALLATIGGSSTPAELLEHLVRGGSMWLALDADELRGFIVCRERLVEAVYVAHGFRRQKVATSLVRALQAGDERPVDAYALPGDRAMKSLYESLGWKARLLTMRGE